MESQEQASKSRVVRVDSEESWDSFISHATSQGRPAFAHFTASWCAPSVAMNPFFDELASTHQDGLFVLVDVDEAKVVATRLEVKAMPTFVLIKEGKMIDKVVGANPEEIKKRVESFLDSHHNDNAV